MKQTKNFLLLVGVFVASTGNALAAPPVCPVPVKTDFQTGEIIKPDEFNNNFQCIDDLQAQKGMLEHALSQAQTELKQLKGQYTNLQGGFANNQKVALANQAKINSLETALESYQKQLGTSYKIIEKLLGQTAQLEATLKNVQKQNDTTKKGLDLALKQDQKIITFATDLFNSLQAQIKQWGQRTEQLERKKQPALTYKQQSFEGEGAIKLTSASWTSAASPNVNHALSINASGSGLIRTIVTGAIRNKSSNRNLNVAIGVSSTSNSAPENQFSSIRTTDSRMDETHIFTTQWVCRVQRAGSYTFYPVASINPPEKRGAESLLDCDAQLSLETGSEEGFANNVRVGVHSISVEFIPN